MASRAVRWADQTGRFSGDQPAAQRSTEGAKHRRERKKRSQARHVAWLAEDFLRVQTHHNSQLPRLLRAAVNGGFAPSSVPERGPDLRSLRSLFHYSQLLLAKLDRRVLELNLALDHLTQQHLVLGREVQGTIPGTGPSDAQPVSLRDEATETALPSVLSVGTAGVGRTASYAAQPKDDRADSNSTLANSASNVATGGPCDDGSLFSHGISVGDSAVLPDTCVSGTVPGTNTPAESHDDDTTPVTDPLSMQCTSPAGAASEPHRMQSTALSGAPNVMAAPQSRQCTALTVDDAKGLVEALLNSASGGLRTLVARCKMCLARYSFDSGIATLLPRLKADVLDFAAKETQWQTQCDELMAIIVLVSERAACGNKASSHQGYYYVQ